MKRAECARGAVSGSFSYLVPSPCLLASRERSPTRVASPAPMVRYTELEDDSGGSGALPRAASVGALSNLKELIIGLDPHMFARKSIHQILVRPLLQHSVISCFCLSGLRDP